MAWTAMTPPSSASPGTYWTAYVQVVSPFQGGPERAVVRGREVSLDLRCGWHQRLHLLAEVEERPERGAEPGRESALGEVRPVPLHGRRELLLLCRKRPRES